MCITQVLYYAINLQWWSFHSEKQAIPSMRAVDRLLFMLIKLASPIKPSHSWSQDVSERLKYYEYLNPHITVKMSFAYLALQQETGMMIDQEITFSPDDTERPIIFTVRDDNIALEPTEVFQWTLSLVSSVDRAFVRPLNTTVISIVDDDGRTL